MPGCGYESDCRFKSGLNARGQVSPTVRGLLRPALFPRVRRAVVGRSRRRNRVGIFNDHDVDTALPRGFTRATRWRAAAAAARRESDVADAMRLAYVLGLKAHPTPPVRLPQQYTAAFASRTALASSALSLKPQTSPSHFSSLGGTADDDVFEARSSSRRSATARCRHGDGGRQFERSWSARHAAGMVVIGRMLPRRRPAHGAALGLQKRQFHRERPEHRSLAAFPRRRWMPLPKEYLFQKILKVLGSFFYLLKQLQ